MKVVKVRHWRSLESGFVNIRLLKDAIQVRLIFFNKLLNKSSKNFMKPILISSRTSDAANTQ